jgi:hypothetical protein
VQIYGDNGFVIVENSLKKKTVMKDESPGVGLENIKMRYEFLSSHKVLVEQNGQSFMVKLPVIKLTEK